ncbi:MAG TPA: hypothetical protein VE443_07700, partial [Beijerinckiaceae bacterium]|nr:hypothetical protein [Beijerinckiaceae bacterium]
EMLKNAARYGRRSPTSHLPVIATTKRPNNVSSICAQSDVICPTALYNLSASFEASDTVRPARQAAEEFSLEETQRRFEALVKAALNTPPSR